MRKIDLSETCEYPVLIDKIRHRNSTDMPKTRHTKQLQ